MHATFLPDLLPHLAPAVTSPACGCACERLPLDSLHYLELGAGHASANISTHNSTHIHSIYTYIHIYIYICIYIYTHTHTCIQTAPVFLSLFETSVQNRKEYPSPLQATRCVGACASACTHAYAYTPSLYTTSDMICTCMYMYCSTPRVNHLPGLWLMHLELVMADASRARYG